MRVPQDVFESFARFGSPDDQRKYGLELAAEQARRVRDEGWAGLYLMSPAEPMAATQVLEGLR